jgi:hypothetical protein
VVQIYFDFWEKHKDLLYLFQKSNLLIHVFEYSYKNSAKIFKFVRRNEMDLPADLLLPYTLAYTVGGMHSMLFKWVENGMTVKSSELIALLKRGFKSE